MTEGKCQEYFAHLLTPRTPVSTICCTNFQITGLVNGTGRSASLPITCPGRMHVVPPRSSPWFLPPAACLFGRCLSQLCCFVFPLSTLCSRSGRSLACLETTRTLALLSCLQRTGRWSLESPHQLCCHQHDRLTCSRGHQRGGFEEVGLCRIALKPSWSRGQNPPLCPFNPFVRLPSVPRQRDF